MTRRSRIMAVSALRYTLAALCLPFLLLGCDQPHHSGAIKQIGILQFSDARGPQLQGFLDGMAELGYREGENLVLHVHNAQSKRDQLSSLATDLYQRQPDLLVATGGLEADAFKRQRSDSSPPVVTLYINSIVERGLVHSRKEPGWPVTGVDNLNAEISGKRVELLHELLPEVKRILVLYYEDIAPSKEGVRQAGLAAEKLGLSLDARAVRSREEIAALMQNLQRGDVDAMLTVPTAPIDAVFKSIIVPETKRLGLPVMAHSRSLVQAGALASYGAPFYTMGHQAARLADKILKGIPAENIPFETPKQFVYSVNKDVLQHLSIEPTMLSKAQFNEYLGGQ